MIILSGELEKPLLMLKFQYTLDTPFRENLITIKHMMEPFIVLKEVQNWE
jgi:hypothetical protein